MITAKITNVISEGKGIRIFADFSNGDTNSYIFEADVDKKTVVERIKIDVDDLNTAIKKAEDAQSFIGLEIS